MVLIIETDAHGIFGFILNKKIISWAKTWSIYSGWIRSVWRQSQKTDHYFLVKGKPFLLNIYQLMKISYYRTTRRNCFCHGKTKTSINKKWNQLRVILDGVLIVRPKFNKMWTVVELFPTDYTSPNDHTLWKKIMQNLGGDYLFWATPEDVSLN